ncbi:MAG TPA: type II toxin-antitoxin system prevent-host-death family antitoxin [Candidatus Paceibacterota bacterium]|nr:type II toxin-antitoxin system prevent-host-death family antitoxin [Candidatus Paceibacterota bacterium]
MKEKKITYKPSKASEPVVMKEVAAVPGIGLTISVRSAKAHLSALLDLVAGGQEVTITSDGQPKAKLVMAAVKAPKVFQGMGDYLKSMPMQTEGPFADEIVRADRDGRGW